MVTLSQVNPSLLQEVQSTWSSDPKLQNLIGQLQAGDAQTNKYKWNQGFLCRHGRAMVRNDVDLRRNIINLFHNTIVGGYSGVGATARRVVEVFYWKGMMREVCAYIRECNVCQKMQV